MIKKIRMGNANVSVATFIVTMLSIISTVVTFLLKNDAPIGYSYIWLLPLSYGLFYNITSIRHGYFKYLGITILNTILIIRYLVLPLFSSISGLYFHSYNARIEGSIYTILIMIYEMVSILVVLHFLIKKLDKQQLKFQTEIKLSYEKKNGFYLFSILIGIISIIIFPAIRERMNFVIVNSFEYYNLNAISSICFLFSINVLRLLFLVYANNILIRLDAGKHVNKIAIMILGFFNISVFWGTNRLTVLAQGIATIALLKALKIISKKSSYILIITTCITIISLSSYRLFGYGQLKTFYNESGTYFSLITISNYFQSYLGGPDLISIAMNLKYDLSLLHKLDAFTNEILSSITFVRQIFPLKSISTTVFFNQQFGFTEGTSMILPTLGQSYFYFGTIGAPILSLIFCYFLYKAEKMLILCQSIGEKYACYILVTWLAFFPMQNLNIVTASFFNIFLPLYLIVMINKKLNKIKQKHNNIHYNVQYSNK